MASASSASSAKKAKPMNKKNLQHFEKRLLEERKRVLKELGHHGEDVSFDSIVKKYELADPALRLLAAIVRAADSRPPNPHPAGEGLRWVAHGFSALGLTDHEILAREFAVYDALYAECRRRMDQSTAVVATSS